MTVRVTVERDNKACTKDSITWSEFVKYWPITIMTSYSSNAEKIGLGGDKSSYPNPGRNLSTVSSGGRACRGLEPLVEVHKEVKQKVTSPKQGRGEFSEDSRDIMRLKCYRKVLQKAS